MNIDLSQQMSHYFTPTQQQNDLDRGGSAMEYTKKLRQEFPEFLKKYNISSMFDAGCNDCSWMSTLINNLDYHGGDISLPMILDLQTRHPNLKVSYHDITTDLLPTVDLLFIKDVTIHLNNIDKKKVIQNWLGSNIPWIMITHDEFEDNVDFNYADGFPFAFVNWEKNPWNFPKPVNCIYEVNDAGRCMALWHRDQICQLLV
jgi:hypothetical protein